MKQVHSIFPLQFSNRNVQVAPWRFGVGNAEEHEARKGKHRRRSCRVCRLNTGVQANTHTREHTNTFISSTMEVKSIELARLRPYLLAQLN